MPEAKDINGRTRSRQLKGLKWTAKYTAKRDGSPFLEATNDFKFSGKQSTVSEGHPISQIHSGEFGGDIGGAFYTEKQSIEGKPLPRTSSTARAYRFWTETYENRGVLIPNATVPGFPNEMDFPPTYAPSSDELDELGATAVARCKPTNSAADVTTALGELLKDGLPSMVGSSTWQSRARITREAGNEYLNAVFGWLPLYRDVSSFVSTVGKSDTLISQYERDVGKVVRRRYNFPIETWSQEDVISFDSVPLGIIGSDILQSGGVHVRKREFFQRRWFSGAFTYALPFGLTSRGIVGKLASRAEIFGLTPTPETLWELAPWSWAVDWFSNTGDVVSNYSDYAVNGLVMRYGYIMVNTIVKDTHSLVGCQNIFGNPIKVDDITLVTETKVRRPANPFGFGLTWDGLSSFQLSIAAALGFSRK